MEDKKYDWRDPNVVTIIDREYLEEDAAAQEWKFMDEDGKMDDDTFEMLAQLIRDRLYGFLYDCYLAVENEIAREKRNEGAEKADRHFKVYWKNENAYRPNYIAVRTYKALEDARDFITKQIKAEDDHYKIVGIKGGIEDGTDYPIAVYSMRETMASFQ